MTKRGLVEHSVAKKAFSDTEEMKGSISVYAADIQPGELLSTWSEVPSGDNKAFGVAINGVDGLLIQDPMDNYCRWHFVQASELKNPVTFVESITPNRDQVLKEEKDKQKAIEANRDSTNQYASKVFEKAKKINQACGPVFLIPNDKSEFISEYGYNGESRGSLTAIGTYVSMLNDRFDSYIAKFGSMSGVDIELSEDTRINTYRLMKAIRQTSFEKQHDLKLKADIDTENFMLTLTSTTFDGDVIETIHVPFEDVEVEVDDEEVVLSRLELDSENTDYSRYGRRIDYEDSMLAILMDEMEDVVFDLSKNERYADMVTSSGHDIESKHLFDAPHIYDFLCDTSPTLIGKLEMASKSYRRQNKHSNAVVTPNI